jgi:DNA-binding transcriptional ArsR family regulator
MGSGIASLHKILKDKTRQKIVSLLNEKGSLCYTELMDATKTSSTGQLNYHLKVLGDLLTKNKAGQYLLTEKGKLASKLLLEFPEDENRLYWQWIKVNLKAREPNLLFMAQIFWTLALLLLVVLLLLNAVNPTTFLIPWQFFLMGVFFLVRYFRKKRAVKPAINSQAFKS